MSTFPTNNYKYMALLGIAWFLRVMRHRQELNVAYLFLNIFFFSCKRNIIVSNYKKLNNTCHIFNTSML
jgi:hypothetical protein